MNEGKRLSNNAEDVQTPRWAVQGPALFLSGMVATLLIIANIQGRVSPPPVIVSLIFLFYFLVLRFFRKFSGWPALGGAIAAAAAIWLNTDVPGELPKEVYEKTTTIRAIVSERVDRYDSIMLEVEAPEWPETGWKSPYLLRLTADTGTMNDELNIESAVAPGDRIEVKVKLRKISSNKIPGANDFGLWLHNNGFAASGKIKGDIPIIQHTERHWWNHLRHQISQWVIAQLPKKTEGLVEAFLVGKRGLIDGKLNDHLQVSGTYHLLAISGQQLAMVGGWSFFIIRKIIILIIPLSRRWDMKGLAAALTFIPIIVYSNLAGWSVSTQRATLTIGLILLGIILWRKAISANTLILSAILLLFLWPEELFGAGFHLTFASVSALLFINAIYPFKGSLWKRLLAVVIITLFMGFATAPIVAYHFHRFVPYGFFGNLFAVPWVGFISIPLGLLALIFHGLLPAWGDTLLGWMALSLEVYSQWVGWIAQWPFAWQRLPGPSLWGISWCVALLAASASFPKKEGRRLLLGLGILALLWPRGTPPAGRLHVACLDVGQALSVVVRDPDGRWMVIDAGGLVNPRFNAGEGQISAYLWHQNVRELERVVISHPQRDHMAGASALLTNFPVKELWLGTFFDKERTNRDYRKLIRLATKNGVEVYRMIREYRQDGPMTIVALPPGGPQGLKKENDRSLVIGVSLGRHNFLFPSDIEAKGETWLLKNLPFNQFSVVVAPHHGSRTSSTPAFVSATKAKHVVFSSEPPGQRWLIPHPDVVDRWQRASARVWSTYANGTIIWETDGKELWMQPPDRGG